MSDINTLNTASVPELIQNDTTIVKVVENDVKVTDNDNTIVKVVENDVKVSLNDNEDKNPINKIVNTLIPNVFTVSSSHLDKYLSFIDNKNVKELVTLLTTNEGPIKDIINIVELIMADGKIDMNDVPLLVSFLKKIISLKITDLNEIKNLTMEDTINTIKLVLIILAKENILKLPDTNQFITEISKILNNLLLVEQVGTKMCSCLPNSIFNLFSKR